MPVASTDPSAEELTVTYLAPFAMKYCGVHIQLLLMLVAKVVGNTVGSTEGFKVGPKLGNGEGKTFKFVHVPM